jgi:HEAT repeat protein
MALKDENEDVRTQAAQTLSAIGVAARGAFPAVLDAVRDRSNPDRSSAVTALLSIVSPDDPMLVPVLAEVLETADYSARVNAALALGRMGEAASPALPALLKALQRKVDGALWIDVLRTTANLGQAAAEALPILKAVLDSEEHPFVRQEILAAIQKIEQNRIAPPDLPASPGT